jgi:chromosomal replication initiation ATPase DnaA
MMVLVMRGKVGELREVAAGSWEPTPPEIVQEVVAAAKPARVPVPLDGVIGLYRLVADYCGIEFEAFAGPNRFKDQVRARQLAVLLAREVFPSASLVRLGTALNRDHTTVLHNLEAGSRRLTTDPEFRADLEALREKIEEIGVRRVAE